MLPPEPQMQIFSNASLEGWGSHLENWEVYGEWSEEERFLHSNALELLAVIKIPMKNPEQAPKIPELPNHEKKILCIFAHLSSIPEYFRKWE